MNGLPLLSVVIPTRNERDNVRRLLARLEACLRGTNTELLFVDDSDDDTVEVLNSTDGRLALRVFHRDRESRAGGLATAVAAGFGEALGEWICVLDADLQHPPELIADLLDAADGGADIVIASRYIVGGETAGLSGALRKVVSSSARLVTKLLFYRRLRRISDPLSGFFLIRRSVVSQTELHATGFKILLEILIRGRWQQVAEVPYSFEGRQAGSSKANWRQGLLFFGQILRLRLKGEEAGDLCRFLAVGLSGVALNLFIVALVAYAAGARWLAWAAGLEVSTWTNFLLNRRITWPSRRETGAAGLLRQGGLYHIGTLAGISTNLAVFSLLTVAGTPLVAACFIGIIAGTLTNYLGASRLAFRRVASSRCSHLKRTGDVPETTIGARR